MLDHVPRCINDDLEIDELQHQLAVTWRRRQHPPRDLHVLCDIAYP